MKIPIAGTIRDTVVAVQRSYFKTSLNSGVHLVRVLLELMPEGRLYTRWIAIPIPMVITSRETLDGQHGMNRL